MWIDHVQQQSTAEVYLGIDFQKHNKILEFLDCFCFFYEFFSWSGF